MIQHHFTVDVEEYFQVSAFDGVVRRTEWAGYISRVHESVKLLLDLLSRHHCKATFFVLGWLAERHRDLVREISDAGHEIASHGWGHERVTRQAPEAFRASVRRTKHELEDLIGAAVLGFRAPSFSIVPGLEWALDILIDEGYRYDSSLFPFRRPGGYGYAGARPDPHWIERPAGRLAEFPLMTLRRFGVRIPAAGGAYFRVFPYGVVRAALRDCERRNAPGMFYVHPWELDPEQPRLNVPWVSRLRHYTGLRRTRQRLERLLGDFRFTTVGSSLAAL
jgi:polysaccharide deacetylase family protein (PEP-CTERM system associated)